MNLTEHAHLLRKWYVSTFYWPSVYTILTVYKKADKIQQLTKVDSHSDEDDEGEPRIEHYQKVENGDNDVDYSRHDVEENVVKQTVDARRATVDHTQHLASLTTEMPA